jgi:hypothetical protein
LLLPEEGNESAPLGLDDRSRSIALILVGVVAGLALLGDSAGAFHFPWPLAVLALVVLLFLHRRDRSATPPLPAGPPSSHPPSAGDPASYAASYPAPGEAPEQATDPATYQGPAQVTGWAPDYAPRATGRRPTSRTVPSSTRPPGCARPASVARSCSGSRSR